MFSITCLTFGYHANDEMTLNRKNANQFLSRNRGRRGAGKAILAGAAAGGAILVGGKIIQNKMSETNEFSENQGHQIQSHAQPNRFHGQFESDRFYSQDRFNNRPIYQRESAAYQENGFEIRWATWMLEAKTLVVSTTSLNNQYI